MTKEVITPEQAMQYLNVLVALDNTQIAKDTLEYFEHIKKENKKQKKILEAIKRSLKIVLYDDRVYSWEEITYRPNTKDKKIINKFLKVTKKIYNNAAN